MEALGPCALVGGCTREDTKDDLSLPLLLVEAPSWIDVPAEKEPGSCPLVVSPRSSSSFSAPSTTWPQMIRVFRRAWDRGSSERDLAIGGVGGKEGEGGPDEAIETCVETD
jgi:hypothetical protein